jgi:hypothetical protein
MTWVASSLAKMGPDKQIACTLIGMSGNWVLPSARPITGMTVHHVRHYQCPISGSRLEEDVARGGSRQPGVATAE